MRQIIISAIMLGLCGAACAQNCSVEKSQSYQQQLDKEYADAKESPLTAEDRAVFTGLDFYPVSTDYCVEARFVRTPDEKPFLMPTTSDRRPRYVKFGEVHFTLQGKQCKLDVFQSLDMVKIEKYKDDLFLPFTDLTSGNGSYGGGRYIDLKQPGGDTIVIDFNTAYNPYCAYNPNYSCPIPPPQNDMEVEVKAGVKEFKKH
jgi:uncharacterized protein (DUF1684 family)